MSKEDIENEYVLLKTTGGAGTKGNVEVSVVACIREPSTALTISDSEANIQKYSIRMFQFLDDERFSLLDALLLQLGVSAVHIPEFSQLHSAKHLLSLLESQQIHSHQINKARLSSTFDTLGFLRGKVREESELLQVERERKQCLSLLSVLFDLLGWRLYWPENTQLRIFCDTPIQCMCLDSAAAEAVNLLPSPHSASVNAPQIDSLFSLFNRYCRTKLGPKTLERWLRQPLLDVAQIEERLNVVEALLNLSKLRCELRDSALKSVPDVQPALLKMHKGTAGLTELFKLYLFSRAISTVSELLSCEQNNSAVQDNEHNNHTNTLSNFTSIFSQLSQSLNVYESLVEHVLDMSHLPELRVAPQHDRVLQELHDEETDIVTNLAEKETKRLRDTLATHRDTAHLCDTVRLDTQNSQYGLCFRTTRGEDERELKNVSLKDTGKLKILSILKNGVYFVTDRLQSLGERLLEIRREYEERQSEVVRAAVETAVSYVPVFETASTHCATLDVLQAFACQAAESAAPYVRPVLLPLCCDTDNSSVSSVLNVSRGRHPCVELVSQRRFVPNDYDLSSTVSQDTSCATPVTLVTGPNTGGKSTYIRTAAVLQVLAQVGSFLPCESARVSITDRVFCRVGAGDLQQRHVSTFLLEMLETARMLRHATHQSLLVIDELGRGTSTAEGYGLAAAIARHIATHLRCRCLFATHFHELTALSVCRNLHVAASVSQTHTTTVNNSACDTDNKNNINDNVLHKEEVVMRYEVLSGACEQSFGIHVAAMTDCPSAVISEAKRKLLTLETQSSRDTDDETQAKKKLKSVATQFGLLHDTLTMDGETQVKEMKRLFSHHM